MAAGGSAFRWDWLSGRRARGYAMIVLVTTVAVGVLRVVTSLLGVGPLGFAINSDFVSFWTASRFALGDHAIDVYTVATHWAAEQAVLPDTGYSAFLYPPVWLLLCLPLGLLPFWWSLVAFLGATGAGYWWVTKGILPRAGVAFLAYPAVVMNVVYGQNGLLTTTLFGGGLLALAGRPWLAGICFGCLAYKPHMAVIVPIALIAGRHWRALTMTALTAIALTRASVTLFGVEAWRAWLAEAPFARSVLEHGIVTNVGWESSFRAVVQLGGGVAAAYAVQGMVALVAVAAMVVVIRRRPDAITAMLPLATLLASPFLLSYDLAVLALPMAWLVREATRRGFRPWEKPALCLVFLAPVLSIMASGVGVPVVGPLAMAGLLAVTARAAVQR